MRWQDEGIVIWRSPFGESRMTVCFLTREHGLHAGLVRCGKGSGAGATGAGARGALQIGNLMDLTWSGRLAEHLGNYEVQVRRAYASSVLCCGGAGGSSGQGARGGRDALLALNSVAALLKMTLPERMPLPNLYARTLALLHLLAEQADDEGENGDVAEPGSDAGGATSGAASETWAQAYCLWELALLEELGYGLDMESCALGGDIADLAFISPKSGRAASYAKAQNYENKLLKLPSFLKTQTVSDATAKSDLHAALKLTGFFLQSRILEPLGKPFPNDRLRLAESFV